MTQENRERCILCGRFKLYNTGGGLICTNMKCHHGISIEDDLKEVDTIRATAYHRWLFTLAEGDIELLADLIKIDAMKFRHQQAFDLLEQTGDKTYTDETFLKAAKMVVEMCEPTEGTQTKK